MLQLIGCCGLFIASKLKEETIVEPDCYVTASCNVFPKRLLLEKERTIYTCIDWRQIKGGVLMGVRQALCIFHLKEQWERAEELLWNCIRDEQLRLWKDIKLVYCVISMVTIDTYN